jgi:hypothetical protein
LVPISSSVCCTKLQDLLGALAQAHPVRSQHNRTVCAHEEGAAQLALEVCHLARQRGLRHVQDVGGLGHVLLPRDVEEVLQGS